MLETKSQKVQEIEKGVSNAGAITKQRFGFVQLTQKNKKLGKSGKKRIVLVIDKRQKFVIAVLLLATSLFLTEYSGIVVVSSGFVVSFVFALLTNLLLFWAVRKDLKEAFSFNFFILPFLYSLAFGMFYFLIPAKISFRMILTGLYAFGLYSLFLSQNIFIVATIRTIALLSGARIVSFVITLLSFFFLSNILISLHLSLIPTIIVVGIYTYLLTQHSVWIYTLQKSVKDHWLTTIGLTVCVVETTILSWFWPSSPTVIALFLTGFFYTINGLSHVWLQKRLFRNVLWEYVWVGVVVFIVLQLFSSWGK